MRVSGVQFIQGRNSYGDRDGRKFGIAIHATDNTASARNEAGYATRRTDGVSAHLYVDDEEVIQSLALTARAGHAGSGTGNENAIAVEITGRSSSSRRWWLDNVAWDRLAQVLAVVCREYDIEPRRATVAEMKANPRVRAFYGHDDMRLAWGGTTHTDPGKNFPWDHLLTRVKAALTGETEDDMPLTDADAVRVSRATVNQRLGSTGPTVGEVLQPLPEQIAKLARVQEATLVALQGADARTILARIEQLAQEERTRDEAAARERAALADLVRQGQDGTLDAAEVLRRMGELLAAAGQQE